MRGGVASVLLIDSGDGIAEPTRWRGAALEDGSSIG